MARRPPRSSRPSCSASTRAAFPRPSLHGNGPATRSLAIAVNRRRTLDWPTCSFVFSPHPSELNLFAGLVDAGNRREFHVAIRAAALEDVGRTGARQEIDAPAAR